MKPQVVRTSAAVPVQQPAVVRPVAAPHLAYVAPAKKTWMVHVHGPTVRDNKLGRQNRQLVIVRRSDKINEMIVCRGVDVLGPSRLVHRHQTPLPETEGNAVAYFESTGEIACYFDPPNHVVDTADMPPERCVREMMTDEAWKRRAQRARHHIYR